MAISDSLIQWSGWNGLADRRAAALEHIRTPGAQDHCRRFPIPASGSTDPRARRGDPNGRICRGFL